MAYFFNFILSLLFPVACINCGEENNKQEYLCSSCFKKIKFCQKNHNLDLEFVDEILIAGDYNDPILKILIKYFKFNSIKSISHILTKFISLFWQGRSSLLNLNSHSNLNLLIPNDTLKILVIPIPLSQKREKQRGFNQAKLIADNFANDFNYKLSLKLKKIKHTKAQSSLNKKRRYKNMIKAFAWTGPDLSKQTIIIIDDVITTGTTINEAARVLKLANAKRIIALAVAKG